MALRKFPTLGITSPLKKGKRVRDAQWLLNGNNRHKKDWYKGEVDGEYGALSGAATHRAKFYLGYPRRLVNNRFGHDLFCYLVPKGHPYFKPLPASYRLRARRRRAAAAQANRPRKALRLALSQKGVNEQPANSNVVKFSKWYGMIGPWCAMFVTWAYVMAGDRRAFKKGARYAYVPYILHDAINSKNGLYVVQNPKPGDLVLFDFDGGVPDHIGLFVKWNADGSFQCVEGNTSQSSQDDGGEVQVRTRYRSQVERFVRVRS